MTIEYGRRTFGDVSVHDLKGGLHPYDGRDRYQTVSVQVLETNNPDLRWIAARALVYFQSDENAEILKGMLDDEATWNRREVFRLTGLPHPHEPELLVRWESWHVLAGWGYDVPKPAFTTSRRTNR